MMDHAIISTTLLPALERAQMLVDSTESGHLSAFVKQGTALEAAYEKYRKTTRGTPNRFKAYQEANLEIGKVRGRYELLSVSLSPGNKMILDQNYQNLNLCIEKLMRVTPKDF